MDEIYATFAKVDFPRQCSWKVFEGKRCGEKAHYRPATNGKGQMLMGVHRYFCEEHVVQAYKDMIASYKKKLFPIPED